MLLVQRTDNGWWTPVTGIVDPGEQPADAAVREVLEEAGVVAVAEHLAWINVLPPMEYENGDPRAVSRSSSSAAAGFPASLTPRTARTPPPC